MTTRTKTLLLAACLTFSTALSATALAQAVTTAEPTPEAPRGPVLRANGKVAFTSDRDGDLEIYVMNSDGTGQLRLTNHPGVDSFPAWSPDGNKLAFVSETAPGAFAIKLMNADGTDPVELAALAFSATPYPWHETWALSWSPDGSKIAFEEHGDIFTIDVDGSHRVNLTHDPAFDYEPSWSPDGSRIVFASSRTGWVTLHTMKSDGSEVQALPSDGELWDMSPDWSPSGDWITFVVHSENFLPVLGLARSDGSDRRVFDRCGAGSCAQHRNKPRWSPDATKIVFHVWDYLSGDCQIYVKAVNGGEPMQLIHGPGRNFQPAWQALTPSP